MSVRHTLSSTLKTSLVYEHGLRLYWKVWAETLPVDLRPLNEVVAHHSLTTLRCSLNNCSFNLEVGFSFQWGKHVCWEGDSPHLKVSLWNWPGGSSSKILLLTPAICSIWGTDNPKIPEKKLNNWHLVLRGWLFLLSLIHIWRCRRRG